MKDNTIVSLDTLEIDMLIHILSEVITNQKIPEVISEEIRKELFDELNITKILIDLQQKLGKEKFSQLKEDPEDGKAFIIKFTEIEIDDLRNGDYSDIEPVVENILYQINQQTKEEA